jgi:pimeloyl-ACP methyl ester carboxylesterase
MEQAILTGSQVNVEEMAAAVKAPTLLIHSRDDVLVPPEQSRWLAALIPNAKLMLIDSKSHAPGFVGSYDELVVREMRAFICPQEA